MFEEVDQERLPSAFLEQEVANAQSFLITDDDAPSSISLRFVLFDEVLNQLWFV